MKLMKNDEERNRHRPATQARIQPPIGHSASIGSSVLYTLANNPDWRDITIPSLGAAG